MKSILPTQQPHEHDFVQGVCFGCGAQTISYEEFGKQKKAWSEYYEKARQTRSAENCREMSQACKDEDTPKVHALQKEAQDLLEVHAFLPQPPFPDPEILRRRKLLVIID